MRRINSVGGMNRSHRLSQGAKKVTPPSIPSFSNPRGSGSSFGSDLSYSEREDSNVSNHPMSTFSRAPNGESSSSSPAFTKLTFEADVIPRRGSLIPKEKTNAALTTNKKSEAIDTAASAIVVATAAVNEDQGIDMTLVPNWKL